MRLSEFQFAVREEFGDYGTVLLRDLHLSDVGGRTAEEALKAGVPPREIWIALCKAQDVPRERWFGVGRPKPDTPR